MRVLHVYRTYYPDAPGGLQEAIKQIALATGRSGVENRIFALSRRRRPDVVEREEGQVVRARCWLTVASCDIGGVSAWRTFGRLARWADILHFHFPWPYGDVLGFKREARGKIRLVTYHADVVGKGWLGWAYRPLMWRALEKADLIVATSEAYRSTSEVLGSARLKGRVEVVPLGIAEESYEADRRAAQDIDVTRRFGVVPNRYFLFVGVLRRYKGLEVLVEAARGTDVELVIAGEGPEGDRLRRTAAGMSNLRFVGQVSGPEKMALLMGCRAVVLPSHMRSEAFGMSLVEAAMCGRPMITCEIGTGTSFVNVDGVTGIVVQPGSVAQLRQAMARLARDRELAEAMGRAARERYEERFSGEPLGRAYSEIYRRLLDGGKPRSR